MEKNQKVERWSRGGQEALVRKEKPLDCFCKEDVSELILELAKHDIVIPYSKITVKNLKKWLSYYGNCGYHHKFNEKNNGTHSISFYSIRRAILMCEDAPNNRFAILTWKEK